MSSETGLGNNNSTPKMGLRKEASLPVFLRKLVEIVYSGQEVRWTRSGRSFLVLDKVSFSENVLSKYFKSKNFSSFVRQLHFYGFHKTDKDRNRWEFTNDNFRRDRQDLLSFITRRTSTSQAELSFKKSESEKDKEITLLKDEVTRLRKQLSEVSQQLAKFSLQASSAPTPQRKKRKLSETKSGDSASSAADQRPVPARVISPAMAAPPVPLRRSGEIWNLSPTRATLRRTGSSSDWSGVDSDPDGAGDYSGDDMEEVVAMPPNILMSDMYEVELEPCSPSVHQFTLAELDQSLAGVSLAEGASSHYRRSTSQMEELWGLDASDPFSPRTPSRRGASAARQQLRGGRLGSPPSSAYSSPAGSPLSSPRAVAAGGGAQEDRQAALSVWTASAALRGAPQQVRRRAVPVPSSQAIAKRLPKATAAGAVGSGGSTEVPSEVFRHLFTKLPDMRMLRVASGQLPQQLKQQLSSTLLPELARELFPSAASHALALKAPIPPRSATCSAPPQLKAEDACSTTCQSSNSLPSHNTAAASPAPATCIAAIAQAFSNGQAVTGGCIGGVAPSQSAHTLLEPPATLSLVAPAPASTPTATTPAPTTTPASRQLAELQPQQQQLYTLLTSLLIPQVQRGLLHQLQLRSASNSAATAASAFDPLRSPSSLVH